MQKKKSDEPITYLFLTFQTPNSTNFDTDPNDHLNNKLYLTRFQIRDKYTILKRKIFQCLSRQNFRI